MTIDVRAIQERCEKLTDEQIAGIEKAVGLTICDTWSSARGHTVEGRISAKDFTDLRRHILALEAENADLRRQITELQAAQRERELKLADFARIPANWLEVDWSRSYGREQRLINLSNIGLLEKFEAFNTQEPQS